MGAMIWLGINGASELRVIAALFGGMTTIFVFNLGSRLFNQKSSILGRHLFTPYTSYFSSLTHYFNRCTASFFMESQHVGILESFL